MSPATWPRDESLADQLLVVDPREARFHDAHVGDLPSYVRAGDLLVVNDAATLPASLTGQTLDGATVEARICDVTGERSMRVLLFGAGDSRQRTEDRGAAPVLAVGDELLFGDELRAEVTAISPASPRLVELAFHARDAELWTAIYRQGRPVQYAHVEAPLELWHVQTRYASRPWSVEMPSAGRPLTWGLLAALGRRGATIASVTHAAGLSSTGDPALDALLPLPERFEIPEETAAAVRATKRAGGRVIAVGTSVTRALEGCAEAHGGAVEACAGITDLVLDASFRPRVVDGLFSGMHEPEASHFRLLEAFAPAELLLRAHAHAEAHGYLGHEFGDSTLILPLAS